MRGLFERSYPERAPFTHAQACNPPGRIRPRAVRAGLDDGALDFGHGEEGAMTQRGEAPALDDPFGPTRSGGSGWPSPSRRTLTGSPSAEDERFAFPVIVRERDASIRALTAAPPQPAPRRSPDCARDY